MALARQLITSLKQFDSVVWSVGAARIVQFPVQPAASATPMDNKHGSLCYRSVHYYSTNPERPYVRLIKHRTRELPLVSCCKKNAYEYASGKYRDVAISVPLSYHEDVCDF